MSSKKQSYAAQTNTTEQSGAKAPKSHIIVESSEVTKGSTTQRIPHDDILLENKLFKRTCLESPSIEPRRITNEEITAATMGDPIYEALAELAIRHGYWIIVNSHEVKA